MKNDTKPGNTPQNQLMIIVIAMVFSGYLLVFMEWLFFVTKPSFLDLWTLLEHVTVLLIAPLPAIVFSLSLLVPVLALVSIKPDSKIAGIIVVLSTSIPSAILTSLTFLMVENFTYTLWGFNVGSFQGVGRHLYAVAIVACAIWIGRGIWRWTTLPFVRKISRYLSVLAIVLLSASTVFSLAKLGQATVVSSDDLKRTESRFPNILILSTDGLDASHMSAYGYRRNTTPFIKSLIPDSLLVENHFTNNAKSTGSIGALFSGKLPTKTRVIYPPDIFRGIDTYQHVPAILRKLGYRNADFSIRHYTDPYDLNMREGFDYANGRSIGEISSPIKLPDSVVHTFIKESYFLEISVSRLVVRLQHALGINNMVNPYKVVTNMDDAERYFPDAKRLEQLFDFIDSSQAPFFAHVHLMVTHGSKFQVNRRVFSEGKKQNAPWMDDFYDDAIISFDETVEKVINRLKRNDLLEETLVIVTSDHGSKWRATERVPLLLLFPQRQYIGVRHHNVQRVDVSATILDYLGVKRPEWVDGESFLHGELEPDRAIFYADSGAWGAQNGGGWRNVAAYKAPYYSLGGVGVIIAQNWYYLDLSKNRLFAGVIRNHSSPVEKTRLPTRNAVYERIADHLRENDYPVPESAEY
jgi:hypothetical protein